MCVEKRIFYENLKRQPTPWKNSKTLPETEVASKIIWYHSLQFLARSMYVQEYQQMLQKLRQQILLRSTEETWYVWMITLIENDAAYSSKSFPTDYQFFMHHDNFVQGKTIKNQENAENALKYLPTPELQNVLLFRWGKSNCFYFVYSKLFLNIKVKNAFYLQDKTMPWYIICLVNHKVIHMHSNYWVRRS